MTKLIKIDYQDATYSFNEDGWFNATIAAQKFGKKPLVWLRQRENVEYLVALYRRIHNEDKSDFLEQLNKIKELDGSSSVSQTKLLRLAKKTGFVRTKGGSSENGGGTWFHPKLAVRFMQWLDIDVAIWCDEQIDSIIRNGTSDVNYLPLFIRENMTVWELRFKPSYYHALARATQTRYDGHIGGTPALYGQITDKWVYQIILPTEVYEELKLRKGKSEKMHQWLTDGGKELLDTQIQRVTDIAASSVNIRDFDARMMQISGIKGQTSIIYSQASERVH